MRSRPCLAGILMSMVPAFAGNAWGQPAPAGPEFQVNTYTTNDQGAFHGPSVAADAAGNFVVVWQRQSFQGAAARRYSSNGTPLGAEFVVNGDEYEKAGKPEVAADAAGNFVVVWESYDCEGYNGVCARRFDSSGAPLGTQFKVDGVSYYGFNPKVAAAPAGSFVVVWAQSGGGEIPVNARLFDSSGTALGPQFQVNTYTTGCCGYSIIDEDWNAIDVAMSTTGDFVVVWNRDPGTPAVIGRAFDDSGTAAGGEFSVNTTTPTFYVTGVGIDADGANRFVTVWDDGSGIRGRRFDETGSALGGEFQVSTSASDFDPAVASDDATGSFVVVWSGDDGDYVGVEGRQFDSSGTALGPSFVVNTYTVERQDYPSIAMTTGGDFVVAWQSYYQDGDSDGIFAQRFGEAAPPEPMHCSATPQTGCRQPTKAKKGRLVLKDKAPDDRDRLVWKWSRGAATDIADFGDPLTTTDYALCVYDGSAETQPRLESRAPAGGDCPGRPCWIELGPEQLEYKDAALDPDGMELMRLRSGIEGKTLLSAKGEGSDLEMPPLPLTAPVRAQLQAANGECWEAVYSQFIAKNEPDIFKAKADPTPCASAAAPACSGECPVGQECVDDGAGCECQPLCGAAAAPACDGICPVGKNCADMGGSCQCLTCGNGLLDPGEECDDVNTTNGDGCSSACLCNPVTVPGSCDLTGQWDVPGFPFIVITVVEDLAGNSTFDAGIYLTAQIMRSNSCGTGTGSVFGNPLGFRLTVDDACDSMILASVPAGFLGFPVHLERSLGSPNGAFIDGTGCALD